MRVESFSFQVCVIWNTEMSIAIKEELVITNCPPVLWKSWAFPWLRSMLKMTVRILQMMLILQSTLNLFSFLSTHFSSSFSNSVIFHKAPINLPLEKECFKERIVCQQVSDHFLPLGSWRRPGYESLSHDHYTSEDAHLFWPLSDYNPFLGMSHFTGSPHLLKTYNLCNFAWRLHTLDISPFFFHNGKMGSKVTHFSLKT